MRPAPPLSAAAVLAMASWQAVRAMPGADRAPPGLWWALERLGMIDSFAHLLPVLAAGAIVAALVQPAAHVSPARPWGEAITLALLVAAWLLPVPVALLVAIVPIAFCTVAARPIVACLIVAMLVPPFGPVALGLAIWRSGVALRLPPHANDNAPATIRA